MKTLEIKKLTAKTEIIMDLSKDKLFDNCPKCCGEVEHLWQPTDCYDDSNPVRMCQACDTAWIWPYPGK